MEVEEKDNEGGGGCRGERGKIRNGEAKGYICTFQAMS
jgi:hypothetical protein